MSACEMTLKMERTEIAPQVLTSHQSCTETCCSITLQEQDAFAGTATCRSGRGASASSCPCVGVPWGTCLWVGVCRGCQCQSWLCSLGLCQCWGSARAPHHSCILLPSALPWLWSWAPGAGVLRGVPEAARGRCVKLNLRC